jgi:hypothetical protein
LHSSEFFVAAAELAACAWLGDDGIRPGKASCCLARIHDCGTVVDMKTSRGSSTEAPLPTDLPDWLRALGLERYAETFQENGITAEILPYLSSEDLKEIGVLSIGHRRQLLNAIDPVRPDQHEKRQRRWLDFSAFLVACIALSTSMYSAYLTRKHDRLSVVPFISVDDRGPFLKYKIDGPGSFEIWMENNGAGVARITSLSILSDLTSATDFNDVMRVTTLNKYPQLHWTELEFPYYLRPGQKISLFYVNQAEIEKLSGDMRTASLNELAEKARALKISVQYESIYGKVNTATWPHKRTKG